MGQIGRGGNKVYIGIKGKICLYILICIHLNYTWGITHFSFIILFFIKRKNNISIKWTKLRW